MTKFSDDETEGIVGTEDYISPEALNSTPDLVSFATDLWSLGVIIWQVFSKKDDTPFSADSEEATFAKIRACEYSMPMDIPEVAADLISKLLVKDPTKRLGAQNYDDLMAHPFFEGVDFANLYDEKLHPAPLLPRQKKLGAQQRQEIKFLPNKKQQLTSTAKASSASTATSMQPKTSFADRVEQELKS